METLSLPQIIFCALVILLAFAVRGGAGFGGGAVAVPLLALVFPVPITVAVVTILNMLSSIGQGVLDWRKIVWKEVWRILPGSLFGVFIGIYLLTLMDTQPLAQALGVFVVIYAIYVMWFADRMPVIAPRWMLAVAGVTSVAAGIIGAVFGGAAGPVYVIYLNSVKLGKDAFRMTITTIMLFQGLTRVAGYLTLGLYDSGALTLLAAALPMMVVGSVLGVRVVRRFDQTMFSRAVGVVLLASGAALIFK